MLQHFQPSQLTDYSSKCGTTFCPRNVCIPVYFDPHKRRQTTITRQYHSIQKRWWKAIRYGDRDGKVFGKPDENEMRVFIYINAQGSLVGAIARTLNAKSYFVDPGFELFCRGDREDYNENMALPVHRS